MATPPGAANPGIQSPVQPGVFESTINKVEDLLKKIQDKLKELFDKINSVLEWVPSFMVPDGIMDKIQALVDKLNSLTQKFYDKMRALLAAAGSPATLTAAADTWVNNIGHESGQVAGKLQANYTKVDDYWKGDAVRQYQNVLTAQHEAFAWVADSTSKINDALNKAASGIQDFWLGIVFGLGTAVVGLVAAIVQCATVVGIPGGIATAIGLFAAALAMIAAGIILMVKNMGDSADAARQLQNDRAVASAFPDGKWPKTTVNNSEFRPD